MRNPARIVLSLAALALGACSSGASSASSGGAVPDAASPGVSSARSAPRGRSAAPREGAPGRSTDDARVRRLVGTVPPELAADARWIQGSGTTLAALRGRVAYVQFAFPT